MHPLRTSIRILLVAGVLGTAILQAGPGGTAEIKGYIELCDGKMCPWHKAVFTPPEGWIEDETWTQRYKAAVLFPNGENDSTKPMMYVRAHHGSKDMAIDDYVNGTQQRWKANVSDTSIEPQDDFARKGKPAFKVFLYRNPSHPEQAFELTAFTKDVDNAHPNETYFFQVVLASPSLDEIEKARPAFFALLESL